MKLRTKFIILIFGIFIFPVLLSALIFLIQNIRTGREFPDYQQMEKWLTEAGNNLPPEEILESFSHNRFKGIEILVLDHKQQVIVSTLSDLAGREKISDDLLMDYIRQDAAQHHFIIRNYLPQQSNNRLLLVKFPAFDRLAQMIYKRATIVLQVLLGFFLVAAFSSLLIIRSFSQAVIRLKNATKMIAAGDLDFIIPVRGKDEIADLTRSFDNMRKALKEEYSKRARFLMGVSHDLKTPLALIQGYVEAIIDGYAGDGEKLQHFLSIIRDKSKLLESRISDLIEYVKMATGEWKMIHKAIPITDFLNRIAEQYRADAHLLDRIFEYRIDLPGDLLVQMDEALVQRVLENIIGNALRYTQKNDTITLSARTAGSGLLIAVKDTGPGIAAEELENIFDPFYRGSGSRLEEGFGLGLSSARSIIQAHGWKIEVSSQPGEGAEFVIVIPPGN